ncbi:glycosyltransferase [Microbacterium sp. LRZ72]|uniref:glycosyltransferase n=1 Tax=Microbacterium sp. LRZ72 TaxID=2942481 RepID=UPI0029BF399A|nr:glycosyltransferase [Microbacterium sp. LRZ72]MDX2377038.1 glycosyltransferase [Microbacterium sp. LRZ72]
MPARVHALLVARADGAGDPDLGHLARTVEALRDQTRAVDALTIVVVGEATPRLHELAGRAAAEAVIEAPRATGHANALRIASARLGAADVVWLLAQDTAPDPDALRLLAGALETQPSVSVVGPKVVDWDDPDRLVSLGVSMTRLGRTVGLVDGQLDQGQHDHRQDALAADIRGLLVRRAVWDALRGADPALLGADEGLDIGVRSRLSGGRVVLVPGARVAVAGDGVAALPAPIDGRRRRRRRFAARTAQLHRRLAYAPPLVAPLVWLALLPLALARTVMHLARKMPSMVLPEWAATLTVAARLGAIARSRRRIREAPRMLGTRASWSALAPLRVRRGQLKRRFDETDDEGDDIDRRGELHFFTGGGAWAVLGSLVVGAVAFFSLLAWPTLGGGGLLPLHAALGEIWNDAAYGARALGLNDVGAADPFAAVVAVIGSLTFWQPSQAFVVLWVLALPLATLGGWFAAARLTPRAGVRIVGAVVWTLAPTFLTALAEGRSAAVLVHLLLPWLFFAGSVARHSWGAAGAASLLFAAVAACAPSLIPALVVLWLGVFLAAGRGSGRVAWLPVPALVMFAPLIWERGIRGGDWLGLFADPGVVFASPQADADAAGRMLLALGFPTPDLAGWATFVEGAALWPALLLAPLGVLAAAALATARWRAAAVLVGTALLGVATAFVAVGIEVQFAADTPVPLWPGAALSLAWIGLTGAAVLTLDAPLPRTLRALRPWAAGIAVTGIIVLAIPGLTAMLREEAVLTNGPDSTLPAYVAAVGREDPDVATIVLTPLEDGGVRARVVWGTGETLTSQSTALTTRAEPTAEDRDVAALAADLVSPSAADIESALSSESIGFVLLADGADTDAAEALALQAEASLDARAGLEAVGDTTRGELWRVAGELDPRDELARDELAIQRTITLVQLGIVAVAVLLAVPTVASRRAARTRSRLVGAAPAARQRPGAAARADRREMRRRAGAERWSLLRRTPITPEAAATESEADHVAADREAELDDRDVEPEDREVESEGHEVEPEDHGVEPEDHEAAPEDHGVEPDDRDGDEPAVGEPEADEPAAGEPEADEPAAGEPEADEPAAGESAAAEPGIHDEEGRDR